MENGTSHAAAILLSICYLSSPCCQCREIDTLEDQASLKVSKEEQAPSEDYDLILSSVGKG